MTVVLIVLAILASLIVLGAISLWAWVQALDVMEALDLRREARKRELQKAREYLKNPNAQPMNGNDYQWTGTGTGGYTQSTRT